ncbi:ATP-binding protein [Jeotgalibacillus soli]|nr:ATP-binding protein [Jeotgalibacillus soli]
MNLLVNFLLIILPLFLLQTIYLLRYVYRFKEIKGWVFAIFPVISVLLCMLFPVAFDTHFLWDLRGIPFILGALYGGYKLGFSLLALILFVRYPMGGDGFYVILITYTLLLILLIFLSRSFLKMSLKKKVTFSSAIILILTILTMYLASQIFTLSMAITTQIEYIVINVLGMVMITVLWEVIRTNFDVLQKLMKADKLEIVSHLAASISHEVRNPLTVSRGFMQLSALESVSSHMKNKYIETAIQELDRAAEIINDYLMFAKPALEKNEKLSVLEEVHHSVNVITPLANMNNVKISVTELNCEKHMILGDAKKFQQCIINILKNGIESMSNGGQLRINISCTNNSIDIGIRDQGKGMSEEQINRLGEPYFTTKEKGTGLGMMVSFSIIKGMNGIINVSSEQGKGTSFTIKLPAS